MFSAISGLRGHQVMMDVIGNNIANVNTVGFKSGRVSFQDILSQTFRGATGPNGSLGSINPAQIGLGMAVAGIDVVHTQGNLQSTGKLTDMAIQGDGFFVLANGAQQSYTRDGGFDISIDGSLVNPSSGLKVQGWVADASGVIDTTAAIGSINIPIGQRSTALPSSSATVQGNLDAGAAVGATASATMTLFDSLGVSHSVRLTFTKTATANAWDWAAATDPLDPGTTTASTGTVTFDSSGIIDVATPPSGTLSVALTNGAVTPLDFDPAGTPVTLDFTSMTQFAGDSEPLATANGFTSGSLITFAVGNGGEITGVYSNGQTQKLGQIAMASFANPAGLLRAGQNMFSASSASGAPSIGQPGTGSRGTVTTGSLEMSNVDLATQFTGMITAQRGFQANGRVITTSDEMLQELVNLKR
jgi:flagellar hook protein FlgE